MNLMETFQLALKNILGSKMRTFLTMLGIIIGVCAVIVIVGLGNGMQGYIEDSFSDMGTDSLTVNIIGRGSSRSVSEEEMYALVEENSDPSSRFPPPSPCRAWSRSAVIPSPQPLSPASVRTILR